MSAWSITFRLILMLALVLNGAASAVAGVRMATGHEHAVQTPAKTSAAAHASTSCHDEAANGIAVEQGARDHAAKVPESDRGPSPDCCTADMCQCACTHCTQVRAPVVAVAKPAFDRLGRVDSPAAGHPAPELLHLIRPPIG